MMSTDDEPWQDCTHDDTITDPDTGEKVCLRCALVVLSEPVKIGTRFVPIDEFNRRLRSKLAELDAARNYCSRLKQKIGGIPCAWPGCEAAPVLRSKWCPVHRDQAGRKVARERQTRHRTKARPNVSRLSRLSKRRVEKAS
jgi:transcription initiation factor TFIIIB Brf1 subunit/transcription initiation factor TFIIB